MNSAKITIPQVIHLTLCHLGPVTPTQLANYLNRGIASTRNYLLALKGAGAVDCIELADGSRRKIWWPRNISHLNWYLKSGYTPYIDKRPEEDFMSAHRVGTLRSATAIRAYTGGSVYTGESAANHLGLDDAGMVADAILWCKKKYYFIEYERHLKSPRRYDDIGDILSQRSHKTIYVLDLGTRAYKLRQHLPQECIYVGWLTPDNEWQEVV